MDPRRLSAGEWITALAGVVVLVSLFGTWYEPGVSGWEAFSVADVIFALTALVALVAWAANAGNRTHATAVAWLSINMILSLIALVVALYRLVDPPGDGSVERALGAWAGTAGVLGVAAGNLLAMRDEGPARRSPERERRAAAEALERAELLPLPGDSGGAPRAT